MILIDRKRLREMIPLSKSTILRMEKRGEFPARRRIGSKVAWLGSEINQWIEDTARKD
jgi:prophage regulatory protein